MDYFSIISKIIELLLVIIVLRVAIIKKHKKVKLKSADILGAQFEIEDRKVGEIELISVPIAACKAEILTPYLKLKVLDNNGKIIIGKEIRLEFYSNGHLMSLKSISGDTVKNSDISGCVVFDNLSLKESGRIQICVVADEITEYVDYVEIFPPGLQVDYWNEKIGSEQYMLKLKRAINFSNGNSI